MLALVLLLASAADPAAALREADRAMDRAVAAHDAAAFAALVDEEALWGGAESLLDGRAAVAAAWSRFTGPSGASLRWSPVEAVLSRSGDLGYTVGTWRLEKKAPDGKVQSAEGRYLTVWRKGKDGAFRAVFDMGLEPRDPGTAVARTAARTLVSGGGDLEASTGTWLGSDGRRGSFLSVLLRGADGALAPAVETAVAFAPRGP
jgi:ketosteroid isomerase-like protein